MQRTLFERAKSIMGTALVGLGTFIFYENLERLATRFSHLLATVPSQALRAAPSVVRIASRLMQARAADHQRFLLGLPHHIFLSLWPLPLVVAGAVLSRNAGTVDVNRASKKRFFGMSISPSFIRHKVELISHLGRRQENAVHSNG